MKIQASSVHRILNCPHSLQLEQGIPEGMRNEPKLFASTFGRDMHDIAEKQLKAFITGEKVATINMMIKEAGFEKNTPNFDKGFNAVSTYVRYVKKHIKHKQVFQVLIEKKYKFKYGRYTLVAKMDCLTVYEIDDTIVVDVFDLKTGNWDYSDSAYDQMYFTALLFLYKEYPKESNFDITIHTVQPNYWLEGYGIVKENKVIEMNSPKVLLNDFLSKIHEKDTCKPGDSCKFCPGLLICPEAMRLLIGFENIIEGEIMNMTIEQLENIQEDSAFIKTFLAGVEGHLIEKEGELKKFRVKHNKKSKKLIPIENPFEGGE